MVFNLAVDIFDGYEPDEETISRELVRIAGMIADGYNSGEVSIEGGGQTHRGWWSTSLDPEPVNR